MLKPTSYLTFTLGEEDYSEDRAASLVRSYSYISPTRVEKGPANAVEMRVKLSAHPFWNASDADEQSTWQNIVAPWLSNRLTKLGQTIKEYNNENARSYCGSISYGSIVLLLGSVRVECEIAQDSDVEKTASLVASLRDALAAAGIDAGNVERVFIPLPAETPGQDGEEKEEEPKARVASVTGKDGSVLSLDLVD